MNKGSNIIDVGLSLNKNIMRILIYIILLVSVLFSLLVLTQPQVVSASAFEDGLMHTAVGTGHFDTAGAKKPLVQTIGEATKVLLRFLGVIFLLLMIYGGYIWMMAAGNETQVEKAKNIIKNAAIGLIIVLAAYAITYFIIDKVYGGAPATSLPEDSGTIYMHDNPYPDEAPPL